MVGGLEGCSVGWAVGGSLGAAVGDGDGGEEGCVLIDGGEEAVKVGGLEG